MPPPATLGVLAFAAAHLLGAHDDGCTDAAVHLLAVMCMVHLASACIRHGEYLAWGLVGPPAAVAIAGGIWERVM